MGYGLKTSFVSVLIVSLVFLIAASQEARAGTQSFNTSDSQFDPGVNNQGWWSSALGSTDSNDNYSAGKAFGAEFRDFFTFDLSSLSQTVVSATLQLTRFDYQGDASETIGFFDVSTDALTLNDNSGVNAAIFNDLGSGASYGSFVVIGIGSPGEVLTFTLNSQAIADINSSAGGYFSIGGALLSLSGSQSQALFGSSQNGGVQRLVLTTVPEPASLLLLSSGLAGLGLARLGRKRRRAP